MKLLVKIMMMVALTIPGNVFAETGLSDAELREYLEQEVDTPVVEEEPAPQEVEKDVSQPKGSRITTEEVKGGDLYFSSAEDPNAIFPQKRGVKEYYLSENSFKAFDGYAELQLGGSLGAGRKFSSYRYGVFTVRGAWNPGKDRQFGLLFGAEGRWTPIRGKGGSYYVEYGDENESILAAPMLGMRYRLNELSFSGMIGPGFDVNIGWDSLPIRVLVEWVPGNWYTHFKSELDLLDGSYDNYLHEIEGQYTFAEQFRVGANLHLNHINPGVTNALPQYGYGGHVILGWLAGDLLADNPEVVALSISGGPSSFAGWNGAFTTWFRF